MFYNRLVLNRWLLWPFENVRVFIVGRLYTPSAECFSGRVTTVNDKQITVNARFMAPFAVSLQS